MRIVSRAEWGARSPKGRSTLTLPSPRLWIHHTASNQGIRDIQAYHMDSRGYCDIAYSFLVDANGVIYEGRGAGVVGGHTAGDNSTSHAICAIGNYENVSPTSKLIAGIADIARHGKANGWWGDITGGHRDAPGAATACPGKYLYAQIPEIRRLAASVGDDMTDEERRKLDTIYNLMLWGFVPPKADGSPDLTKPAFGPSGEMASKLRYVHREVASLDDTNARVKLIEQKVNELEAAGTTGGISQTDKDELVSRTRDAVVAFLTRGYVEGT